MLVTSWSYLLLRLHLIKTVGKRIYGMHKQMHTLLFIFKTMKTTFINWHLIEGNAENVDSIYEEIYSN